LNQCIAINPNSAEKAAAVGFVLISAGEFERGFGLLNYSVQHNPFSPWWYRVAFVYYFLNKKRIPASLAMGNESEQAGCILDPMLKTSVLGHLNRIEEAHKAWICSFNLCRMQPPR
jgi:hypothetical protein